MKVRKPRGLPPLATFALGALAAVAIAGPAAWQLTSDEAVLETTEEVVATPTSTPSETPTPVVTPSDDPEAAGDHEGGDDNHGKVVSTAAHCDVKGKAHGELVRGVAQEKDATVADAEAACEAAKAALATASAEGDHDGHGKGPKNKDVEDVVENVAGDDSGSDDDSGPGRGKGPKDKDGDA